MALQVGELVAMLTVDDRAYDSGLRDAERQLRQVGDRLESDAERAGTAAGEALGEGVADAADDGLTDLRRRFARAAAQAGEDATDAAADGLDDLSREAAQEGEQAGEELGDGMEDSAADGADATAQTVGERLKGGLQAAALAVGAAAGAVLMSAWSDAMDQSKITARLGAQLGATTGEAKRYGRIAGALYAEGVTEDFQGAADAISTTMRAGILPTGATEKQIRTISTAVSDLATTFELDLGQTANSVGQMLKTGLAKDGTEALDILTAGMQKMGPRADDIADTFNEYSTNFRSMGLSGADAVGLMVQGLEAGARDTDVIADAVKEFSIEAVQGSEKIGGAWKKLGLDSDEMFRKIGRGGDDAREALDQTLDELRKVEDPVKRNALAVELFGTKAEDLGASLYSLDPSEAVKALGDVGGAADKMGDALRDSAGARLESFKRGLQQNVVDFLGGPVLGAIESFKDNALGPLKDMWEEAGKGPGGFAEQLARFLGDAGGKVADKIIEWAPKILAGIQEAAGRAAAWVAENPVAAFKIAAIGGAFLIGLAALPALVAVGLAAAAIAMIGGFVAGLIDTTQTKLPEWWQSFVGWFTGKAASAHLALSALGDAISRWFGGLWGTYIAGPVGRTWVSFVASVRALPGRAQAALSALGGAITRRAVEAWTSFRSASARKVAELIGWVRGIPSRAAAALGAIGSRLYSSGRSLIQGFISGILSRIAEVRSAASSVVSAARDYFPFSPAKRGPFAGRGYTSYSGAALIRGFEDGITSRLPHLAGTLASLPSAPPLDVPPVGGYAAGSGAGATGAGAGGGPQVIRLEFAGPSEMRRLIRAVVADSGGNVQTAFGR